MIPKWFISNEACTSKSMFKIKFKYY
jgi:hypothetical protein